MEQSGFPCGEQQHLDAQGGVSDFGLVLLREVKLALFLEARACVALTQDLALKDDQFLSELLRDTTLVRDDGLREMLGLLVR